MTDLRTVWLAALPLTLLAGAGSEGVVRWNGPAHVETARPDGRAVSVRVGDNPAVVLEQLEPPRGYTAVMGRLGSLPTQADLAGRIVRLSAYRGRLRTDVAAIESRARVLPDLHDAQDGFRLDYVREYFDLGRDPEAIHVYSLAAGVLAQHRLDATAPHTLWIRDRLDRIIFFYDSKVRAENMIARFGSPALLKDVPALQKLLHDGGSQTALAALMPFAPKRHGDGFVGWWGGFPIRIYTDESGEVKLAFSSACAEPPC